MVAPEPAPEPIPEPGRGVTPDPMPELMPLPTFEEIPEPVLRRHLGGGGLAAYLLLRDMPAGVDPLVMTVSVDEHVGVQEAEEKAPVAPAGKPEVVNETV